METIEKLLGICFDAVIVHGAKQHCAIHQNMFKEDHFANRVCRKVNMVKITPLLGMQFKGRENKCNLSKII